MTGLVLYDFALDENCYKVRLLLGMLGLDVKTVPVDMVPGAEQTRPPLRDKNPLATLPILEHRDGEATIVLREAEAILAYLARRYDPEDLWLPQGAAAFAETMAWLVFATRDLDVAVRARRAALWGEPGDEVALRAATTTGLRAMEDHMTRRGFDGLVWFVAEGPTIADIALFPAFALSRDIGIDHESFPALRRWMRRVRSLPGFSAMPGIPDYF